MQIPATASDVHRLLGDLDPVVLERLLEIGASPDEIGAALCSVEDEHGFGEERRASSSSKIDEVRALLDELAILDAGDDDDRQRGDTARDTAR